MDEAFLLRARRLLGEQTRPRPDHPTLLAQVAKRQAASPTARLATGLGQPTQANDEAAATLIAGAAGWRGARAAQSGCFNRAVAVRGRNTP